jgi:hypothetical protein
MRHSNGQFMKGTGGRAEGSRNKLQKVFLEALAKDFEANGEGAINIVRVEKPADYLRIVASVLPKEFVSSKGGLDMSDAELEEALEAVRAARRAKDESAAGHA